MIKEPKEAAGEQKGAGAVKLEAAETADAAAVNGVEGGGDTTDGCGSAPPPPPLADVKTEPVAAGPAPAPTPTPTPATPAVAAVAPVPSAPSASAAAPTSAADGDVQSTAADDTPPCPAPAEPALPGKPPRGAPHDIPAGSPACPAPLLAGGVGSPAVPPTAAQPLPSSVINKQPMTADAQYMQQQSHIFVFSTQLANRAYDSVMQSQFPTIIAYHCSQPGAKKYLDRNPLKVSQFSRGSPAPWLHNGKRPAAGGGHRAVQGMAGNCPAPCGGPPPGSPYSMAGAAGPPPSSVSGGGPHTLTARSVSMPLGSGDDGRPLTSVQRLPDEELTPEQRHHRAAQLATLKRIGEMLLPDQRAAGAGAGSGAGPAPPSSQPAVSGAGVARPLTAPCSVAANVSGPATAMATANGPMTPDMVGPGGDAMPPMVPPGGHGSMMSQVGPMPQATMGPMPPGSAMDPRMMGMQQRMMGPGGPPTSVAAQMQWQRLQSEFYHERRRKGINHLGAGGPVGPQGPGAAVGPQSPGVPMCPQCPTGMMSPQCPSDMVGPRIPSGMMGPHGPGGPMGPHGPGGPMGPQCPGGAMSPHGPQGPMGPYGPGGPMGFQSHGGMMGPRGPESPMGGQGPGGPMVHHGPGSPMCHQNPGGPVGLHGLAVPMGPQCPGSPMGHQCPGSAMGPQGPAGPMSPHGPAGGMGSQGPGGMMLQRGPMPANMRMLMMSGGRMQGPPPPYPQAPAARAVAPCATSSPTAGGSSPTASLPRTSPRLGSPAVCPRLPTPGPSPHSAAAAASPRPVPSPSPRHASNPATPASVASPAAPMAGRVPAPEFTPPQSQPAVCVPASVSPAAPPAVAPAASSVAGGQPQPVAGDVFCRSAPNPCFAQQPAAAEDSLMPVPSPQQIQYINNFEGQELTIRKQTNTGLGESDGRPASVPSTPDSQPADVSRPGPGPVGAADRLAAPPAQPSNSTPPCTMDGKARFPAARPQSAGPGPALTPAGAVNAFPGPHMAGPMCGPGPGMAGVPGRPMSAGHMGGMMMAGPGMAFPEMMAGRMPADHAHMPLNPQQPPIGMGDGKMFDPISSMVQMSQQLTGGSGAGSPGAAAAAGEPTGAPAAATAARPPGVCSGHQPASPKQPAFGRRMSPTQQFMGAAMMAPRMAGGVPFSGTSVQVKASAPNTIQYLPTRPQTASGGPRAPPSLEFLQRFTGPAGGMPDQAAVMPAHGMPMTVPGGPLSGGAPMPGPAASAPGMSMSGPMGMSNNMITMAVPGGPMMGPGGAMPGMPMAADPRHGGPMVRHVNMMMGPGGPMMGPMPAGYGGGLPPGAGPLMVGGGGGAPAGQMGGRPAMLRGASPGGAVMGEPVFGAAGVNNNGGMYAGKAGGVPLLGAGGAPEAAQPLPPSMSQPGGMKTAQYGWYH